MFGEAEPRDGASGSNADRLKLGEESVIEQFIVTDLGEDGIVSGYTRRGPLYIGFGCWSVLAASLASCSRWGWRSAPRVGPPPPDQVAVSNRFEERSNEPSASSSSTTVCSPPRRTRPSQSERYSATSDSRYARDRSS